MRTLASLACALLLSACAHAPQSALPFTSTQTNRTSEQTTRSAPPSGVWLCGVSPSAQQFTSEMETAVNVNFKNIYKFKAQPDAGSPFGALLAYNGKLYGTTYAGGKNGYGAVFETTTSGAEHVIYSFRDKSDGANPCSGLVALNGKLYGTAAQGGSSYGWGTVYEVSTSGQERTVYTFHAKPDGAAPYGGLLVLNGKLYGTTVEGGKYGYGAVFDVTTSGSKQIIYSFRGGTDGAYPYCTLIAVNGKLYGTTMQGGAKNWGAAFSLTTGGQERVLHSFKAQPDGAYPFDGLTAVGTKLYGTAKEGGAAGYGAVFYVTPSAQEHVVYSFKGGNDGAYPYAGLLSRSGALYGATYEGGKPNWGTIFKLAGGKETVLHAFQAQNHGTDGAYPFGALTDLGGKIYGTAEGGGINYGWGTVYTFTP